MFRVSLEEGEVTSEGTGGRCPSGWGQTEGESLGLGTQRIHFQPDSAAYLLGDL